VPQSERKRLIERIQGARRSKILCYLTSDRPNATAQVAKDAMPLFFEHLQRLAPHQRTDVVLFTEGGDTIAGFGLSRLLREFSKWVGVLIPSKCLSAGTLFALGANEVVMTRGATLSPIDPSLTTPLNPAVELTAGQRQLVPLSVESVAGFKTLVTDDWEIKGEAALSDAFKILAERVHPLALGDVVRARQQIARLATTLLRQHRSDEEHVEEIVRTLTRGFGSHDYLISRSEAQQMLGKQIEPAKGVVENCLWELYQDFAAEMRLGVPFDPSLELHAAGQSSVPGRTQVCQKLAVVESELGGHVFEREILITRSPVQIPGAPPGAAIPGPVQAEVVRLGWQYYPN
jgi:hypothetical protein